MASDALQATGSDSRETFAANAETRPRVSICIPVYNGANFLEAALDSIAAQTFEDYELIVTDNASIDATESIMRGREKNDPRIRYIRNPENLGAAENYNLGFRLSRGEYIKWMAHDDLICEEFLERTVKILDDDPGTSIAFGHTEQIDEAGEQIPFGGTRMPSILGDDPVERFSLGMAAAGGCFPIFGLFRASDLARSSLHRSYYGSDRALLCEILLFGKHKIDESATFLNRTHQLQSIRMRDRRKRAMWQKNEFSVISSLEHFSLLRHLFEMSGRHKEIVSPVRLRLRIILFSLRPKGLLLLWMEFLQVLSPSAAGWLRKAGNKIKRTLKPS